MAQRWIDFVGTPAKRASRAIVSAYRELRGYSTLSSAPTSLIQTVGVQTKSGANVTSDSALAVSSVYACSQILSGIIARLPLELRLQTAKGSELVRAGDHPCVSLVSVTPDGFRTSFQWRQMLELITLLRGNSFSRIVRNAYFEPIALKWLNPLFMEIWRTEDGDPFYRYKGKLLDVHDVFHHREMAPDGVVGLSPVTCMREQIGLAIVTQEHGSRYFSNGAAPMVVFTAPLGATKEQMDRIRDEILKNHGGVSNSSKPMIAYGGLTVSPISLTNEDSQFLESRKFDVEEIARAYRVPLHLLQSTEKTTSWGSGIEQLNRAFVDYSLADRLKRWEEELNLALLTTAELAEGYGFKFDTSELTMGSNTDRANYYQTMRNIAAMSVNDVREAEGMDDLPDNIGDRYDLPFNATGGISQSQQEPVPKGKNSPANAK